MDTEIGLFEDEREANRSSTIAVIEVVLEELGHDVAATRAREPAPAWHVERGGATVDISLVEREDFTHFRVTSPVLALDPDLDSSELFARLLRLNADALFGAAFALREGGIVLVSERSTLDLDKSEIRDAITRIQDYAAHYHRSLAAAAG